MYPRQARIRRLHEVEAVELETARAGHVRVKCLMRIMSGARRYVPNAVESKLS